MNVCQQDFNDIRLYTIRLLLPPEDSKRYLDSIDSFSHKVLSKIKNVQKQLTLHCDNIVHLTASSLKLQKFSLKCSNTHEIALFPEWQEYLSNRDSLHLDNQGNQTPRPRIIYIIRGWGFGTCDLQSQL